jgi:Tfp pilus assembly protein PilV
MKFFRLARIRRSQGFSLVEAAFSLGVLSFGFLSLTPLVGLGLTSSRQARNGQLTAQIAMNFAEQAREGMLTAGSGYCDNQGAACASTTACYRTQTTETTLAGNCTRLTIQVMPIGNPTRAQDYAVVLPPQ